MLTYISNSSHYKEVLSRVSSVKHLLWIGTADIKDLYVEIGNEKKPFLALIAQLIRRGVEVRLIHAKEPGPNFREDFDKYPVLYDRLERVLCPRVHFKMLVFDGKEVYIGSANLTGAGIGMKAETTRNFEANSIAFIAIRSKCYYFVCRFAIFSSDAITYASLLPFMRCCDAGKRRLLHCHLGTPPLWGGWEGCQVGPQRWSLRLP